MLAKKKKKKTAKAAPAKKRGPSEIAKDGSMSRAARVAALLRGDKKATGSTYTSVIMDPSEPPETATRFIMMPFPWQKLTGVKGVPFGHIVTIQGKPDSGKTTIAMHAMVEAQAQGYNVVLIDTEYKFNFGRFTEMGGNLEELLIHRCRTIEDGFEAIDATVEKFRMIDDTPTLFVWDSLGMTPTDAEMNDGARKQGVAGAARVIKRNIRREVAAIYETDVSIIFVNHIYANINAMFGNSTKGYGGDGPAFASVLVLEAQKIRGVFKQVNKERVQTAVVSVVKCTKNHMSAVQGAKAEVKIGPQGIETGQIVEDSKLKEAIDDFDEDDDDYVTIPSASR